MPLLPVLREVIRERGQEPRVVENYKRSVIARHCRGAEHRNAQLLGQHAQDPCKCKPDQIPSCRLDLDVQAHP